MLLLLLPWIKTAYFRACVLITCLLLTLIEYYEYGYILNFYDIVIVMIHFDKIFQRL